MNVDHPVGVSILGGLLIVGAIGCMTGLLANLPRPAASRLARDMALGIAGAFLATFLLPMHGITPGALVGGYPAAIFGAILPIALVRLVRGR
jgi:uncharacterized membrane protein YeaQ/YmgE (transglycosylase-associated protein family)